MKYADPKGFCGAFLATNEHEYYFDVRPVLPGPIRCSAVNFSLPFVKIRVHSWLNGRNHKTR
jgi:hypothetical protein